MSTDAECVTKHTPGPWEVYNGRLHDDVFRKGRTVCAGQDATRHAVAYCDYMWPERAEANARLIAAAPDMLKALQQIADISEGSSTVNSLPHLAKIARTAIAKAEGRDGGPPKGWTPDHSWHGGQGGQDAD